MEYLDTYIILFVLLMIYMFSYKTENMEDIEIDCDDYSFDDCPEEYNTGCRQVTYQSKGGRQVCAQFNPESDCGAYRNGSCPLPMCKDDHLDENGACIPV